MKVTTSILNMINLFEENPIPPMILLDITNACNMNCIHCAHTIISKKNDYKIKHLDWLQFKKIIFELSFHDQPCLLRIVSSGEPMMHPKLIEMIEFAKENTKCIVNLTTNGSLLFPEKCEKLLKSNIDIIDISIDAMSKSVYNKIRQGGVYEQLMCNIFHLLQCRVQHKAKTKVVVSFVKQNENYHETDFFKSYWSDIVDFVMIRNLHSASGKVKQQEVLEKNVITLSKRYPCPHLWKRLIIDSYGRIKFCATDWELNSLVSTIDKTSLKQIWNNEKLKLLRKQHIAGSFNDDHFCKKCNDWATSQWDWGYERIVDKLVMEKPILNPCLPLI